MKLAALEQERSAILDLLTFPFARCHRCCCRCCRCCRRCTHCTFRLELLAFQNVEHAGMHLSNSNLRAQWVQRRQQRRQQQRWHQAKGKVSKSKMAELFLFRICEKLFFIYIYHFNFHIYFKFSKEEE